MDPKTGLYSKAAKVIRSLPQESGTASELVAAARNKFGLKEAELKNAGPLPEGPITREELAQIFEARLPRVRVDQLGENPSYLSREERMRLRDIGSRLGRQEDATPEERAEFLSLQRRATAGPNVLTRTDDDDNEEPVDTEYGGYASDGTQNYRERLLRLERRKDPVAEAEARVARAKDTLQHHEGGFGPDHPITQQSRDILAKHEQALEQAKRLHGEPRQQGTYQSSHWDHPDVLAHIRLSDRSVGEDRNSLRPVAEKLAAAISEKTGTKVGVRDLSSGAAKSGVILGVITPEEAASLSRVMGWTSSPYYGQKGIGKRLLHVEELQSDWAQEGRDKGFHDPANPYEIFETKTGKTVSKHPTYEAMWDAYRSIPEEQAAGLDYGSAMREKPPAAPYVTNTQHWTDLALKNVLREAALGGYDGIIFPAGQNQADRYGLDKFVDEVHYEPETKTFYANSGIGNPRRLIEKENVEPEQLSALVGRDVAEKLLDPANQYQHQNTIRSTVSQDDLKVSATGMKGYYDNIVPKSVMQLARQHDPAIQPAESVSYDESGQQYQGFHLPMTDKLRQSILNEGFPAMRRGGRVDAALEITRRFTKNGKGATLRLGVKE